MLVTRRACATFTVAALVATPLSFGSVANPAAGSGAPVSQAVADSQVVLDWQRTSMRTIYTEAATPIPIGALYLGFTSGSMYDAVKTAYRRHASPAAAAAVAGHDVLLEYFGGSEVNLAADLTTSLDAVPDGSAKERGMAIGARAADDMIDSREDDGRDDNSIVYDKAPRPGIWQPAPNGTMLAPWLGFVDPLVLARLVRVNGPDPITTARYAFDYEEVKRVGRATEADRTAFQTETAQFFNANAVTLYCDALVRRLEEQPVSLRQTARLFARVHGALTDSVITVWRLKYRVGFWRPVQAIQGAGGDGNPATVADPAWQPLIPNPSYSDYVSGHAGVTGSIIEVIRRTLGEETPLLLRSSVTGTERQYTTLTAIEFQAFHARIWGGLHFRDAMEDGYEIAHTTARQVMSRIG